MNRTLIILGSGYTARVVYPLAARHYPHVYATSRAPAEHLNFVPLAQRLQFDLAAPSTWSNIPPDADLLWCFPAAPLQLVESFSERLTGPRSRLVVLGSTSAYEVAPSSDYPPPWIDETAPIDLSKPRVQGEEYLRKTLGAMVLRVAGIYGPGRNPLNWIKTGRVTASRKFVNLIHVEDLAAICLLAFERGTPGHAYNVSDGTPRTWREICETAHQRWGVQASLAPRESEPGKRIAIDTLSRELGYTIRHPDLYAALAQLLLS